MKEETKHIAIAAVMALVAAYAVKSGLFGSSVTAVAASPVASATSAPAVTSSGFDVAPMAAFDPKPFFTDQMSARTLANSYIPLFGFVGAAGTSPVGPNGGITPAIILA